MVDKSKVAAATTALLEGIGEDPQREGLLRTPHRVSEAWAEILSGTNRDPKDDLRTTFDVGSDELVLVQNIEFQSLCEHHLLPFVGRAHIAYLPREGKVTGLSKLGRCVEGYARRLQVQERLTAQVAQALQEVLNPRGVAVIMEAEHMCMTLRGIRKSGATTATSIFRGDLDTDAGRAEVFNLLTIGGLHR